MTLRDRGQPDKIPFAPKTFTEHLQCTMQNTQRPKKILPLSVSMGMVLVGAGVGTVQLLDEIAEHFPTVSWIASWKWQHLGSK